VSAEIVDISGYLPVLNEGNGARAALIDSGLTAQQAELVMMELWARGFKIIPLSGDEG
jgi:hypothetical protein